MSIDKKIIKKFIGISATVTGAVFVGMSILARKKKPSSIYEDDKEQKNSFEGKKVVFIKDDNDRENVDGVKGHLEVVGNLEYRPGFYEKRIKRVIDVVLSFGGLVILSPIFAVIALAIKIEDPGPVLFTQKRVGQNKRYFKLHKFRSMKMSTPHDVPTHQLENPEQYITKVGKFLRAHSLDELPQIWDIFIGNMSVIGPRPGLWNQDLLTAERDKYCANNVKPGLTGWAQINGRDELEIPDKAKLDGEYVNKIGLLMDINCFLGSLHVFGKDESVVEGGTGEMKKQSAGRHYTDGKSDDELIGHIGFGEPVQVDIETHKNVLITGAGSYIGETFRAYATEHYGNNFTIDELDMLDPAWQERGFSKYDIVYHVAGIVHADVGNVSDETREKYYAVNTDLAIEVAKKAKREGVKEFIFMSSMIVYGESAPYGEKKIVNRHTVPVPENFYGDSKFQADVGVRDLANDNFKIIVLRPPMIYGKGSKGNYPTLAKLVKKLPVFPDVDNKRSMLYIENLCEFLCQIMLVKEFQQNAVVLIPQNGEWTKTSKMAKEIAEVSGKKIRIFKALNPAVSIASRAPGKIGRLVNKAFGNSCYVHEMSIYEGIVYQKISLSRSVEMTETTKNDDSKDNTEDGADSQKKVLVLASVASMIDQFNMSNIAILQEIGYKVEVACNFEKGNTCSQERIVELKKTLENLCVDYHQIDFTRNVINLPRDFKSYQQVKALVVKHQYSFVHCHSPIGGFIGRLICHETGIKVIYTAHGFHFYDGAPRKNWLIYYPIEKFLSRYTDVLITINKEDYHRAKEKFHARCTVYIPGVGVDTAKYAICKVDKAQKRNSLGVDENDFLLLSVGELSERKNQKVIIDALGVMREEETIGNIVYLAVGQGDMQEEFERLVKKYKLEGHVKFLGFRTDIDELCEVADCFVHPSVHEGIGIAHLEALAAGLPFISSLVNGIKDYTRDYVSGCCVDPSSVEQMVAAIKKMRDDEEFRLKCGANNILTAQNFDIRNIDEIVQNLYSEILTGGYRHIRNILSRQEIRKDLGIDTDDFLMISVGELNENKNHQVIMHAMSILDDPHIHYCLCGIGDKEQELKNLASELRITDRVHFFGFRQDVDKLLSAADLFCFPSKREGLGLAALEAMSAGLPIVTSNIHGINDYSRNGVTGYSCTPNSPQEFAKTIRKLANGMYERIEMRRNNIEIVKKFDITQVIPRMKEIYMGVE